MKIEHIAIWTNDLERLASFYETYFDAKPGDLYSNEIKHFKSQFLTLSSGCRLELMQQTNMPKKRLDSNERPTGYGHLAFSVGSKESVDAMTIRLVQDGYEKLDGPRVTGDGYYESALRDPDGNVIEITI